MQYIKVSLFINTPEQGEVLIALLAASGYDGFEELDDRVIAYTEQPKFYKDELEAIAGMEGVAYTAEILPAQNWNALWESNFPPVVVADFCTIRADFHDIEVTTPYEILITPKMSFGTGHHATTQLMMLLMKETDLNGKTVLDFGTGTGVLAILAEMLGAGDITAIDNDDWCVENAKENIVRNKCSHVDVLKGSLEEVQTSGKDIILANINRHILLHYMSALHDKLNSDGIIIMSGLLTTDRDIILKSTESVGFRLLADKGQANWLALKFCKHID